MYVYCKDEFDWLLNMIKRRDCFGEYQRIHDFIDESLLELRYMKKRFGYLFYDCSNYIKKVDGRNAIFVNREHEFVCRKPDQSHFHGRDEEENTINHSIPMEDTVRYEIKYLDEIDKGDPFITNDEKKHDEEIKNTTNLLKKIKLIQPEIYNDPNKFIDVLYSKKFDQIVLEESEIKNFYEKVREYVLSDFYNEEEEEMVTIIIQEDKNKYIKTI